jgi:hypothetical protein
MNKERKPGEEQAPNDCQEENRSGQRQLGDSEPQPKQPDDPSDPARRKQADDQLQ